MASWPASRPNGGDSRLAPPNWKIAMPASGPIIQGNGVPSHAHRAPDATHTASAPPIAAALPLFMACILPVAAKRRFRLPVAD